MQTEKRIKKLLASPPAALKRLGKDIFLPVSLYKAKKTYKPVYIDRQVFNRLFSPGKDLSFEEMSAILQPHLNFTIEKEKGTGGPIGTAYVDRQADPLNISLAGNLGSGRAYYTGKYFNIKGEKTPLAVSDKRRFSDGLLEMERCIWEAMVANGLQGSFENGLNSVLAILDMDETCNVVWRDQPVKRGKIIRVDLDGALDRVSHVFYNKTALSKKDILRSARKFGIQEADKFIQRIVHGTWSPGNISPDGHLIDFDTVAAVRGRMPQYSSTQWHHENYFGYEYMGQLNILRAMAADKKINAQSAKMVALEKELVDARLAHIRQSFVTLMGFKDHKKIYKSYKKEIDQLCDLWMELAQKGYNRPGALSSKHALCISMHAFDFSAFFRLYPLQKRLKEFSIADALSLLCETSLSDPFQKQPEKDSPQIEQDHRAAVMSVIGKDFVKSDSELDMLKIAAAQFIKKYDLLHSKITREKRIPLKKTEARAYIINEDRFSMFPAYTLSYILAEREKKKPRELDGMINALVLGTRRIADDGVADVRLYKNGYSITRLDGKGSHKLELHLYKGSSSASSVTIKVNDATYRCKKARKNSYLSRNIDNSTLLENLFMRNILYFRKIMLVSHSV